MFVQNCGRILINVNCFFTYTREKTKIEKCLRRKVNMKLSFQYLTYDVAYEAFRIDKYFDLDLGPS